MNKGLVIGAVLVLALAGVVGFNLYQDTSPPVVSENVGSEVTTVTPSEEPIPDSTVTLSETETLQLLEDINNLRNSPVDIDPVLYRIALERAKALAANGLPRNGPSPAWLDERLRNVNYNFDFAYELVAVGHRDHKLALQSFVRSVNHNKYLRDDRLTKIGLAIFRDKDSQWKSYYVVIIAKPK